MKVKLIAASRPIDAEKTSADLVAYCARVSNPANQDKPVGTLLAYLVRHQHWSPFEMVSVCMEIETNRAIARQILRHRSFSFQEFSQRYAAVEDMEFEISEARLQDTKNRQNSIDLADANMDQDYKADIDSVWRTVQFEILELVKKRYKWALDSGIAKEVARNVLPEGLTPSRMYMNGTLRSWIHYCQLRMGNGTQKEHRAVAAECWRLLCIEYPFLKELDQ